MKEELEETMKTLSKLASELKERWPEAHRINIYLMLTDQDGAPVGDAVASFKLSEEDEV